MSAERDVPIIVSDRVGRWLDHVPMVLRSWPILRRFYWQDWQMVALAARVDDVRDALEWYPHDPGEDRG